MGRPAKPRGAKYKHTGFAMPDELLRHLGRLAAELAVRTHGQEPGYIEKQSIGAAVRWLITQDMRRRTTGDGWRYYLNHDKAGNVVVEWEHLETGESLVEGFDNTRPILDGPLTAQHSPSKERKWGRGRR